MTATVIVVVTGLPGAGKSTLARAIGHELGWPVLALDSVKEALVDGLGEATPADRFVVRRAARAVVARLVAEHATLVGGCLVDIWVNPTRDESDVSGALGSIEGATLRELVCVVPPEVAIERYAARDRHRAHLPADQGTLDRIREAAPRIGPLGLGPHRIVDTSTPVIEDRLIDLATWLRGAS